MGEWPQGWQRSGSAPPGRPERPAAPALPPELDPRGGRPRPARTAVPRADAPPPAAPQGRVQPPGQQPPGQQPPGQPPGRQPPPLVPARPRRRRPRLGRVLLALLLVVALFYAGLALWGMSRLERVEALSGRAGTAGTTWLLVGSDSREGLTPEERRELRTGSTEGRRTDTIILLHDPPAGAAPTLVSLPRDSYVEIPGRGANKLNAAFALGGPPLLVETVEGATGLTVDHYVEVGFGGIVEVVDAVGGVEICVEEAISDERSGLDVPAGCQRMDGGTSLSYIRARYFDPSGDLGRIRRQQQFLGALVGEVFGPRLLLNPLAQIRLVGGATDALLVDTSTGPVDLLRLAWAFRAVTGGDGVVTTVPVADTDFRVDGAGSTVRWDEEAAERLFAELEAGDPVSEPAE